MLSYGLKFEIVDVAQRLLLSCLSFGEIPFDSIWGWSNGHFKANLEHFEYSWWLSQKSGSSHSEYIFQTPLYISTLMGNHFLIWLQTSLDLVDYHIPEDKIDEKS